MRAVVLVSGGMDSATLLHYVHRRLGVPELLALSFRYGQKHARELAAAEWQCRHLAAVKEWRVLDLPVLGEITAGASALTGADIPVPDLQAIPAGERQQPITYVPNRNLVLLGVAAAYAEAQGCATVYYGAQAQDEYGYWDCTAGFVEHLNAVLALNRRQPVRIVAPFTGMRKAEELRLGLELGVDYAHTWSCYRGGDVACGTCPSCRERLAAFAEAGVPDPVAYAK